MKKIIITGKQLKEAMNVSTPGLANNFQKDINTQIGDGTVANALKGSNGGYSIQNMDPAAKNGKDVTLTTDQNGIPQQSDINSLANLNPNKKVRNVKFQKPIAGTNTTATLAETSYSKKHIEEVRSLGKVMTKRALEESWGRYGDDINTIDDIVEKLRLEMVSAENRLNNYVETLGEISKELKLAVEEIKEALQRNGVDITGTEVNYYGDGFTIKIKTNWILKTDSFYGDEEDEALYRSLSNVTGAEYNYTTQQWGRRHPLGNYRYVHFGIEEGDGDCNPYFEISCDIPDLNDNKEGY